MGGENAARQERNEETFGAIQRSILLSYESVSACEKSVARYTVAMMGRHSTTGAGKGQISDLSGGYSGREADGGGEPLSG